MCIQVKLSLYLCNFGPVKGPLDVLLLWLVLYVVALPIGDGLQHPHQALHEVLQVHPPRESCSESDFREKFANTYFQALCIYIYSSSLIKITFVVQELKPFLHFLPKKLSSANFLQKTLPNKKFQSHNNENSSASSQGRPQKQ